MKDVRKGWKLGPVTQSNFAPRVGYRMTPRDRELIARVARDKQLRGMILRTAYVLMLGQYYAVNDAQDPSPPLRPVLVPVDERPSFRQFRYHLAKELTMTAARRRGLCLAAKGRS